MKKNQFYYFLPILIFFLGVNFSVNAQEDLNTGDLQEASDLLSGSGFENFDLSQGLTQESALGAFLGYSKIGDQNFVGMRLQPDLNFGKFGVGLNIPIMFNMNDWSFRKDEFQDGVGLLRIVDYVRYGVKKRDPLYVRVGSLYNSWIGYGILLDNYSNQVSFDKRKIGATFDILIKNFIGVEGLYSDFDMSSFNLFAVRPYVKPLGMTGIPVVKSMDIGFTYVTDHDYTKLESANGIVQNQFIQDGQNAWSVDIGIIPINLSFMQLKIYAQYGKLKKNTSQLLQDSLNILADTLRARGDIDNPLVAGTTTGNNYDGGNGTSIGADFRFNLGAKTLQLQARIERLWYTEFFMPQFYNAGYELNKDAKLINLAQADGKKGVYGSLTGVFMEKVLIGGSLMIPDNVSETAPAFLTVDVDASKLFEKFIVKGQYLKGGLAEVKDVFKFDERSLATARVAYKMGKFIMVGLDYKWTWTKGVDGIFEVQNHISPYIGFSMPLGIGLGGDKKVPLDFDLEDAE